jgi:tRNA-specific 2-thiouridylase
MALSRDPAATRAGARGCCSIEDASDARRAAARLGLDYYVWDLSESFEDLVVADFLAEYKAGRTPNPCVRCNQWIKFKVLWERAQALGFDAICTGHYARLTAGPGGVVLRRAADQAKDQSYVLAGAGPAALASCLFPLGDVASKAEVRAEAARLGLPVAAKPDSFDICFVADADTRGFLRSRLGSKPGEFRDAEGAVVGRHDGYFQFTIGQRRGLHLGDPAPDGQPRYVTGIDPVSGVVTVGPVEALAVDRFGLADLVWFEPPGMVEDALVQVRAHGRALPGRVEPAGAGGGRAQVGLAEPLRGLAAGQSAVVYRGDRVVAHGLIER